MLDRLRPRLNHSTVVAYLALFLALGGGAFAATNFVGSDGKIRGCVTRKGKLTLLKPGKHCREGRSHIAWNKAGQRGPRGAPAPGLQPPEKFRAIRPADDHLDASEFTCVFAGSGGCEIGWHNADPVEKHAGAYWKDLSGVVHLVGAVSLFCAMSTPGACDNISDSSTVTDPDRIIFGLPEGYRPYRKEVQATVAYDNEPAVVEIYPRGGVAVRKPSTWGELKHWVSLDGITFRAEH